MVSVVIPTVRGREEHVERCVAAYREHTVGEVQLLIERDHDCCGKAWNAGAARATGKYLHLTADDLEPYEGWNVYAQEAIARGFIPAPNVFRVRLIDNYPVPTLETSGGYWDRQLTDWTPTLGTCVVPFCLLRDWHANIGPSIDTHYFSDNWFTDQCRRAGMKIVVRTGYVFTHHWASERRGAGMTEEERMAHDRAIYEAAIA